LIKLEDRGLFPSCTWNIDKKGRASCQDAGSGGGGGGGKPPKNK
jgi:hypothetical protein